MVGLGAELRWLVLGVKGPVVSKWQAVVSRWLWAAGSGWYLLKVAGVGCQVAFGGVAEASGGFKVASGCCQMANTRFRVQKVHPRGRGQSNCSDHWECCVSDPARLHARRQEAGRQANMHACNH